MIRLIEIWSLRFATSMLLVAAGVAPCIAAQVLMMPLGDSITWGYPFNTLGGYRTKLWHDFGSNSQKFAFVGSLQEGPPDLGSKNHEGHSGFTIAAAPVGFGNITDHIATYLGPSINPNVILLMIGTNDINFDYQVDGAPARLDHLISLISDLSTGLKPNAELIVSNILPIDDANNQYRSSPDDFSANSRVMAFNAAIPGIVAAHRAGGERVYFTDMNSLFTFSDLYDGLHPTPAGYNKLADAWYRAIRAVPEPNSLLLSCIGVFTLGLVAVRRRGVACCFR